jgi:hypothetical protein
LFSDATFATNDLLNFESQLIVSSGCEPPSASSPRDSLRSRSQQRVSGMLHSFKLLERLGGVACSFANLCSRPKIFPERKVLLVARSSSWTRSEQSIRVLGCFRTLRALALCTYFSLSSLVSFCINHKLPQHPLLTPCQDCRPGSLLLHNLRLSRLCGLIRGPEHPLGTSGEPGLRP